MFKRVSYTDKHKYEIVNLMGNAGFKQEIWDWQFTQSPFDQPFNPIILANENKVVGFNGVMPIRVQINGIEKDALWSCDFYVDAEVRGKGLGKSIKVELHQQSDLIMALGISPSAEHVLQKMGWKKSSEVYGYDRFQRIGSVRVLVFSAIQLFNKFKAVFRKLSLDKRMYTFSVDDCLPAEAEVDSLWESVKNDYDKIVKRNYRYLDWKYQCHPLAKYNFIVAREDGVLSSILVYRVDNGKAYLVDYLGPHENYNQKYLLVEKFLSSVDKCDQIVSTTSDGVLGKALIDQGFVKKRNQPRFYVYSNGTGETNMERGWFIMSGDSDGELLLAARSNCALSTKENNGHSFIVEVCGEEKFFDLRDEWSNLLSWSDADKLFMSWSWMYAWWETWSKKLNAELLLITVRENGKLIGVVPLYAVTSKNKLGVGVRDLHMIGNARRIMPTVRSEYMDVIAENGRKDIVIDSLLSHISQLEWDSLSICDYVNDTYPVKAGMSAECGLSPFLLKKDIGVVVDVSGDFSVWKSTLGKDFRLKAYNRRTYLSERADLQYCEAGEDEVVEYFDELNKLHSMRWGSGCFVGLSLEFHKRFISLRDSSQKIRFSSLKLNGQIESILYDVEAGDKIYNLQAGFNEKYDKKVSLGSLHLGYAIERAFNDPQIRQYDLLAGGGKKTFYKQHFKGGDVEFFTVVLVRKTMLKLVYSVKQRLVALLRRPEA